MRENMCQKNFEYGHFSGSEYGKCEKKTVIHIPKLNGWPVFVFIQNPNC